jgi:hypothetical protein
VPVAELDDARHMQHVVEAAAVPGAGEAVVGVLAAGGVDRGGAGPGREVAAAREPGDITEVSEDPGGASGADPADVHQV